MCTTRHPSPPGISFSLRPAPLSFFVNLMPACLLALVRGCIRAAVEAAVASLASEQARQAAVAEAAAARREARAKEAAELAAAAKQARAKQRNSPPSHLEPVASSSTF